MSHFILGDKVRIYMRERSPIWQASTRLEGKEWRISTKTGTLSDAKEIAEDWYFELRGKSRAQGLHSGKTFQHAAKQFMTEYPVITEGLRSERYVQGHQMRLDNHLLPFFGSTAINLVNSGMVQDYRVHRLSGESGTKKPSQSTLHHEIVTLRQVMKTALRRNWIEYLPDFSQPYQANRKVSHRAWFSPEEYKTLYTYTRKRVEEAEGHHWQKHRQQLHDYILFMANSGLRPDEANRLQFRDVSIDDESGERILVIEVRGKRGVGYCKSTVGAVHPFERLRKRHSPESDDLVFKADHKKQFNIVLDELGLKFDREGNRRSSYSLRHTYICLRLLEGADIYQIAKNCRTSVEMVEKHYAVHLKNTLDAKAINVRRVAM